MVLGDTSVWIDHLREKNDILAELLSSNETLMHPMVIGELACGNIRNRVAVLTRLRRLPMASVASYDGVLSFIEEHRLMGRGIDYVDVHLLASVAMDDSALLWTLDRRLGNAAEELSIAYTPEQERRTIL